MAIEFECPQCAAVMRVPDAYAGKQGRCPQCETRLLVPVVARPGQAADTSENSASGTVVQQPAQAPGSETAKSGAAMAAFAATPAVTAEKPQPGRTPRRHRSRRRPSRALVIGIPVIGFLLLLGIIAWSLTNQLPELNGNLAGSMLAEKSLPRVIIPWSDTGLGPADRRTLQDILAENAETLSSELVNCRLIGTDAGIAVQWTASASAAWCRIDAVSDEAKPLSLWLKKERPRLNALRRTELLDALSQYCRDKLKQASGEELSIDAGQTRDAVALNSGVDALGFSLAAKVGNKAVRPAMENEKGQLFICVPAATQTVTLAGRNSSTGILFPGHYTVLIAPAPATEPTTEEQPEGASDTDPDSSMEKAGATPDATPAAAVEDKFGETMKMQSAEKMLGAGTSEMITPQPK